MPNAIRTLLILTFFFSIPTSGFLYAQSTKLSGELKKWHKITLAFEGPECSETDEYNPFFNYRLDVTFYHQASGKSYRVPGYFAADGNAGQTSATSGNIWKVHFAPDEVGEWTYSVDFKKGNWVAVRYRQKPIPTGEFMDGEEGEFEVSSTDKTGRDFRAKGRLFYVGTGYLQFAETGTNFFKCGPDAPENLLAYVGFDGDFAEDGHKDKLVKTWEAHLQDWDEGDPFWGDGRGKELIGVVNYLASKGMNSMSFLTNNIAGDDQNVFPYIDYDTWDRFDCSKLDQWEIVFEHAQQMGIFLHFKTLEAENQGLLDNGGIGGFTKLYYRELIARFGHHLALNWNLCEEVGDWWKFDKQPSIPWDVPARRSLTEYLYQMDPYHHHMVIHNGNWFTEMYGDQSRLTGASLQTGKADFSRVHAQVLRVKTEARKAGKEWAVACDEPGDAGHSLITDEENPDHFNARTNGLWGAMLAGAWGTEWYFGYKHPHSDLTCQDFRSRDKFWDMGKHCIAFFDQMNLPVTEMNAEDALLSTKEGFCFAKKGDTYVILLKKGGEASLDLNEQGGKYTVHWYNPREGGELQTGSRKSIRGDGSRSLGLPPADQERDWVVLVRKG